MLTFVHNIFEKYGAISVLIIPMLNRVHIVWLNPVTVNVIVAKACIYF